VAEWLPAVRRLVPAAVPVAAPVRVDDDAPDDEPDGRDEGAPDEAAPDDVGPADDGPADDGPGEAAPEEGAPDASDAGCGVPGVEDVPGGRPVDPGRAGPEPARCGRRFGLLNRSSPW